MQVRTILGLIVALHILSHECILGSRIKILKMRSRNLSSIPDSAATLCHKCQSLDLSENKISRLPNDSFRYFSSVKYIYLRENSVNKIESNAFSGLSSLVLLDLSANNITRVDEATFESLSGLKRLLLSKNPLVTATLKSNSLTSLDLSYCLFETLSASIFSGLPQLETVDLNHNALHSIDVDVIQVISRIGNVYLEENPWRCDCLIYNLTNKSGDVDEGLECLTEMGDAIPWSQFKCPKSLPTTAKVEIDEVPSTRIPPRRFSVKQFTKRKLHIPKVTSLPSLKPDWHTTKVSTESKIETTNISKMPNSEEDDGTEMAFDLVMFMICVIMVAILMLLVGITAMFLWPYVFHPRKTKRRPNIAWRQDEEDCSA